MGCEVCSRKITGVQIAYNEKDSCGFRSTTIGDRVKFCPMCGRFITKPEPLSLEQLRGMDGEPLELSCVGCQHEPDMPSHVKCHGCARMYTDNYTQKPEQEGEI